MTALPSPAAVIGTVLLAAAAGLSVPQAQAPPGIVAMRDATVIDGTGRAPLAGATILILDGRIAAVGPSSTVDVPPGAMTLDMRGKTIVPGLINAHGHLNVEAGTPAASVRSDLIKRLRTYASYGVTTVVSLGATNEDELEGVRLQEEQEQPGLDRARVYSSARIVTDPTPGRARQAVDRLASMGVQIVKFRLNGAPDEIPMDAWTAAIDEARRKGMIVAVHIFDLDDAKAVVDAGAHVVAHSVRDQDVDDAFITAMKQRDVAYIPTLTRDLSVFVYETVPAFFSEPFFRRGIALYRPQVEQLSDPAAQSRVRNDAGAQAIKPALAQATRNLGALSRAGVRIAMGTDSGAAGSPGRWQGYFEHVEMEMMVAAGMTPLQVITAATGDAARAMSLENVGTIQPGKWADLLVLNANPAQDIRNTRQIDSVWLAGRRAAF